MSDLSAMSEDELRGLKREKYLAVTALREEMLEIEQVYSTTVLARKAKERELAKNTPGAVMAEIDAAAAAADAGGETP